ncbi:hypothetical protein [Motiliproteus sp. MSK22-1]|uniref:hypothetical protein n=1 Tax=Motiliproteus sp. MSK22-1 TaxID=1897630 RepID=UPI0009774B82|nr:hypothetical protein [Motiliproteus sp. MSK22-1]OMH39066.1 hypothetical protein BGP75_04970 [Motiliproteus sp. MSK22-1]
MKLGMFLVIAVLLSGCASVMEVKQDVNICYFGEIYADACQSVEVADDENLVCIDMSTQVEFEIMDCDLMLNKSRSGS